MIDPEVQIPVAATKIHGISNTDVKGCRTFTQLAKSTQRFLHGCDYAGYNLKRFDLPLLAAEFERCNLRLPLRGRAVIDAMQIFHENEPRDLQAALAYYCNDHMTSAHDAECDVAATARVLDAQLGRYN